MSKSFSNKISTFLKDYNSDIFDIIYKNNNKKSSDNILKKYNNNSQNYTACRMINNSISLNNIKKN